LDLISLIPEENKVNTLSMFFSLFKIKEILLSLSTQFFIKEVHGFADLNRFSSPIRFRFLVRDFFCYSTEILIIILAVKSLFFMSRYYE